MRFFKTKKSKVVMTCLAVILIASILCVSLAGCKQMYGETPIGVYFLGDFQSNVDANTLNDITASGSTIVGVKDALAEAGIDINANPAAAAAAIYALAVTNYNNITQSGYLIVTDAMVNARKVSTLANKDVSVGIRSTYSFFQGKKGSFSQTVSGVTQLNGVGSVGDQLKTNFGYCEQIYSGSTFYAKRVGSNGGAQFPTENDIGTDVYKYILGAYNKSLSKVVKGNKLEITPENKIVKDPDLPEYVQTATEYPSDSTLKGVALPEFNENRLAWQPLNRIPYRYWEKDKNDKITGKIIEDSAVVEGTRYSYGNYGASFAFYDFSRPQYLSDDTKITYSEALDLYTIEVKVKSEYVQQACEFAAGDLVKSTKDYISLKNAKFTELSCKYEVYGNGLIKSMQKKDVLNSNDNCPLVVLPGNCKNGGTTSNTATIAFSYSDNDTDAERLVALYWHELGNTTIFKNKRVDTNLKLDLSGYTTFDKYKPVINTNLVNAFTNLFATKK